MWVHRCWYIKYSISYFPPHACRSEMGRMHCLIFSTIIGELFVSFLPATWHSVLVVQMMLAYWNLWLNSLMNVWYNCSETVYCSTAFLVVNLSIILTSISTQCSMWIYSLNWKLGNDLVLGLSRLFICWLLLSCSFSHLYANQSLHQTYHIILLFPVFPEANPFLFVHIICLPPAGHWRRASASQRRAPVPARRRRGPSLLTCGVSAPLRRGSSSSSE
jgi:hypothetical protein